MKCKVCGKRFIPKKHKVYRVKESIGTFEALTKAAKTIECIDCPRCGTQRMLNIREERPVPPEPGKPEPTTNEILLQIKDILAEKKGE